MSGAVASRSRNLPTPVSAARLEGAGDSASVPMPVPALGAAAQQPDAMISLDDYNVLVASNGTRCNEAVVSPSVMGRLALICLVLEPAM
jgi:hypothetical protein